MRYIALFLVVAALVGCDGSSSSSSGSGGSASGTAWTQVATVDTSVVAQEDMGVYCDGQSLYIFAGLVDDPVNTVWPCNLTAKYNISAAGAGGSSVPASETYMLPQNLWGCMVARTNQSLLAFGGADNPHNPYSVSTTIWKYFPATREWRPLYYGSGWVEDYGYVFVYNGVLYHLVPRWVTSHHNNQVARLEWFDESVNDWVLVTSGGALDTFPNGKPILVDSELLIADGVFYDQNGRAVGMQAVVALDLAKLPQIYTRSASTAGTEVGKYLRATVLYASNGKVYVLAGDGWPVAGVYEYDVASNSLSRRQDLDPPFDIWSKVSASQYYAPVNGSTYIYLYEEFNGATRSSYDRVGELYRFQPR